VGHTKFDQSRDDFVDNPLMSRPDAISLSYFSQPNTSTSTSHQFGSPEDKKKAVALIEEKRLRLQALLGGQTRSKQVE
jgi:hypothetical protein